MNFMFGSKWVGLVMFLNCVYSWILGCIKYGYTTYITTKLHTLSFKQLNVHCKGLNAREATFDQIYQSTQFNQFINMQEQSVRVTAILGKIKGLDNRSE